MGRTRSDQYDTPIYKTSHRGEVEGRRGYGDRETRQIDNYTSYHGGGSVLPYRGPSPLMQRHPAAALAYRNPYPAAQQRYPPYTPVTNYSSQPRSHPIALPQHHHHARRAYQFHPPPSESVSPERFPRKSVSPERSSKHNTVSVSPHKSKPVKTHKQVKVTKEDLKRAMDIPAKKEPDTRGRASRERIKDVQKKNVVEVKPNKTNDKPEEIVNRKEPRGSNDTRGRASRGRSKDVQKKTVVEVKPNKIKDKPEEIVNRKEPRGPKHRRHSKNRSRRRDNDDQDSEDQRFAQRNNQLRESKYGKYRRNNSEEEEKYDSDSESEIETRNDSRRGRRHEEKFDSERGYTSSANRSRSPTQRSRGRHRYGQDQYDSIEVAYCDEPWYVQASTVVQESCSAALDCGDDTDSDSDTENYETIRGKRSYNERRNPKRINCCSEIIVPPWLCCVVAVVGLSIL